MGFINYIKGKLKYLLGIAGMAALLSQLILPALGVKADGPRFNFLPGDLEMVRGVNVSNNEAIWKDPVTGNAGQIVRGLVYYHNGMVDTTAVNTRVKVTIPSETTNKKANVSVAISADNAATITDTVVEGQIVGLSGLNINLDKDADLEFIPGSVRWFPNSNQNGGPSEQPQVLPQGQSGNEIVSANGVNIGDIQGCWPYAGFISFDLRTKVKPMPSQGIAIKKLVRNVTAAETGFVKETKGKTGDIVEFKVEPQNTGEADLTEAILKDSLPVGLAFVPGSFQSKIGAITTPISNSDAAVFFGSGLNIGTLQINQPEDFYQYNFKATVTSINATGYLVNTATVTAAGLSASSSAKVEIVSPNIIKSKSAYNETKKEVAKNVDSGDIVTYTLTTKNSGTAGIDYVVSDSIKEVLQYSTIQTISDGGKVTGEEIAWPSVNIAPDQTITRTFQVKMKENDVDATITNIYGNKVEILIKKKVVYPVLHIDKFVKDITTSEANFQKANLAFAGDTLEYMITFSNTGSGPADTVKFSDSLPANTQYLAGTTRISWNGNAEQTLPDGIDGAGVTIPTITVGENGYVKLRVKITSGISANEILVNTGHLTHRGETISAVAQTTITAKPIIPVAAPVQLPKSGATASMSFLVTMAGGMLGLYAKYRKLMSGAEVAIINQMLG